jgi:predicted AlkP superfamily pyrophosphatase or phosphodiesterase
MRRTALAFFLAATAACSTSPAPRVVDPRDRLVVLISVDGLAAFYHDDPKADMPTLRRLAREGCISTGLRGDFPTVTWPNHTTLVTGVHVGRHGVIGNSYMDRETQKTVDLIPDPLFDKDQIVKVPTVYDLAHAAGLKTAGIIWPATRNAKTLHWTVPDVKPDVLFRRYGTAEWLEELRRDHVPVDMQETWCKRQAGGAQRDWMYARAAAQVIRRHRPNLVLLHLIEADHVQHQQGPQTPDAYWACRYEDDRVREVLEAVEEAGLRDRATFFIVSDHGFIGYSKTILPNVALRKAGLIKIEGDLGTRQAYSITQGGGAFVYVLDRENRAGLARRAKEALEKVEGVAAVIEAKDFPAHHLATPEQDPRMPDLVLSAKDGYAFVEKADGDAVIVDNPDTQPLRGTHGYLPSEPKMLGTFIAWGAGIRAGVRFPAIESVDVAPTVARLLGLTMQNVDGRPREEILSK